MKLYKLLTLIFILFLSGCDVFFDEKKPIVIESVDFFNEGKPEGYRGKAIKIIINEKIKFRTITYKIHIVTKNGFEIDGGGYLSSSGSPEPPTKILIENMFLWVPRHDDNDMQGTIAKHIRANNIELVKISTFELGEQLSSFEFTNL